MASAAILSAMTATTIAGAGTPVALSAGPALKGPTTPARDRALEVLDLINAGRPASTATYVRDNFAPSFLHERPADQLAERIGLAYLWTRGVDSPTFTSVTPNEATVQFHNRLTHDLGSLTVGVEPSSPFRITALRIRESGAGAEGPARQSLSESAAVREVAALAGRLAAADAFSGVVMIARGDHVLFQHAYGLAERSFGAPIRIDTKFNLGSMNKMFTGVAIARLVEQGRLSFDDRLSRYVPDFPDAESASRIQIKHLLSHTSGLGSFFNDRFRDTPPGRFRNQAAYVAIAGQRGLNFAPGTQWDYSNTGMLMLGQVISTVTGRDYYDYMRETLFRPLEMNNTDWYELDSVTPNMAQPYETRLTDNGLVTHNAIHDLPARGSSAGGGYSTARDLLRFSRALMTGRILRPSTLQTMTSPKPELNSPAYGYGFDLGRFAPPGRRVFGHDGDSPGACAVFGIVPSRSEPYTLIILANSSLGSCHALARKAYQVIPQ